MIGLMTVWACASAPPERPPPPPPPPDPGDAVDRAVVWLQAAVATELHLNFDASIGTHAIAELHDTASSRALAAAARAEVDDGGNPARRFFDPDWRIPKENSATWTPEQVTKLGSQVNRVLLEALYCPENGWREQTTTFVCGPLRDEGGYGTAHAAWALNIAIENGCVEDPCLAELGAELAGAIGGELTTTLDIDLHAERILMAGVAGHDPARLDDAVRTLLALQGDDGGWDLPTDGDKPYYRFHATMLAAWAIADWTGRRP